MKKLPASAPVPHAGETPGRAAGALAYGHVACTEYLTLMHVGDRCAATIDAGGVLGEFTGVLVRDGYAGYEHIKALHAWCGAHLLRDPRSISDADPEGRLWATAMATTLTEAHQAATQARESGADRLDDATLKKTRANGWLGEVQGLQVSLEAARKKLASLGRLVRNSNRIGPVSIGMPIVPG